MGEPPFGPLFASALGRTLAESADSTREMTANLGSVSAAIGETVTDPRQIGPALDRAFASGVPYLVNVITDVEAAYPRATFGI